MRGDGGVVVERRVVVLKLNSWGKCIMPLTNINSDWIPTLPLASVLTYTRSTHAHDASPHAVQVRMCTLRMRMGHVEQVSQII